MSAATLDRFARALSIVLPTPIETALLRACLGSGDSAREAWARHRRLAGDLRRLLPRDRSGLKKLMPLLLRAVKRNDLEVDDALLTVLRTAHLRATLRGQTVRAITHDVLQTLRADQIPYVVLDGAALVETVYEHPALRHCGTIEVLLRARDVPGAARRLRAMMGVPPDPGEAPTTDPLVVRHASGLPVELRAHLLHKRDHPLSADGLFQASRATTVAGVPARVLSPPDALLDVCLRAFFWSGRAGNGWVADAWYVLERCPGLDWDFLLARAREGRLELPLLVTLSHLAEQLDAPIPATVLGHLRRDAERTDAVRRERALAAAVAGLSAAVTRTLRLRADWRARLTIARWMLLPSPRYVRANYELAHAWQVPFFYVYRPLRFVARRLGARGG